jgi:hypothetical protein
MNKPAILTLLLLLISSGIFAQNPDSPQTIGGNHRIYPSNVTQTEAFITKDPGESNGFFVTCNTITFIPFFISEGVYVTSDAGTSWRGDDTCTGNPVPYHAGDPGIAVDKNGTFILTHKGQTPFVGLYSHYSLDRGLTWSAQKVISTDDLERASLVSDFMPASPYFGRTYAAWVKFATPFPIMFSYTNDGAKAWADQRAVNNPSSRSAGGDLAMGLNGKVYVCWAGVTETTPFKEILVGFARSSNGGDTWTVTENAFPVNGISGVLPNKSNIRVNGLPTMAIDTSGGPRRGWIYIVTCQKDLSPSGSDPDIILYRSTDDGATWSPGIRVNQDALNNGKTQYFPAIHVDRSGAVDIIFYDDRRTTNDSAGVFLARSRDGGNTWTEYQISDHNYKPVPIGGLGQGYQGDNIDLSSTSTKLISVWMDNSSGIYQLWTNPIDFTLISAIGEKNLPGLSVVLDQNQPNPFNSSTTIHYRIRNSSHVSLKVYDVMGNQVCTLADQTQTAGAYTVPFDAGALPDGIYFYTLRAGDEAVTKKAAKGGHALLH